MEVVELQGLSKHCSGGAGGSGIVIARAPSSAGVILATTPGGAVSRAPDGVKLQQFTASGCLTILDSGCGASANYLVVAGGGGGGNS